MANVVISCKNPDDVVAVFSDDEDVSVYIAEDGSDTNIKKAEVEVSTEDIDTYLAAYVEATGDAEADSDEESE